MCALVLSGLLFADSLTPTHVLFLLLRRTGSVFIPFRRAGFPSECMHPVPRFCEGVQHSL